MKNEPQVVAVKVLKLAVHGADRSFIAECEALSSIRHRNLVKVITSCSSIDFQGNDFKALVYSYMVNGSLEDWLHQKSGVGLNFLQRLNIVIDLAGALNMEWEVRCQPMAMSTALEITDLVLFKTRQDENTATNARVCEMNDGIKDCLTSVYGIGTACSTEIPGERIEISNALDQLQFVKKTFLKGRVT